MHWEDSIEPTEYTARTGKFGYYIKSRDEDGLSPFRFQIFSEDTPSRPILEIVSADFLENLNDSFRELYNLAKGAASGLSSKLTAEVLEAIERHRANPS
ncbi:hypothetical protein [Arenivirga flava]|uniref:Uncharacterized protein n=2 Tax=Arenivirga flava TaxID=1930060 RepID=A0AA37X7U8_9MICO|nr:hypothetical protein [Arenivirga flava]GMA26789.1 hypothetical protein GCM10025874_00420 [Arenivirga flava]GMA29904.1 hypothetical protein GCM10025874_31570 [Arenivirga flava]GMA29967.1 hypothetical protein GCM10025874_32200 [Arenivirga flava]